MLGSAALPGLIGRNAELDALVELLAGAEGEVALLAGDAGIGKTRLIDEALQRASVTAFVGRTSPASVGRRFDLLLTVVEPIVRHWNEFPRTLAGVAQPLAQLIGPIAPKLTDLRADSEAVHGVGDLVHALIALIRHLDVQLLVVEDLHWADIESLHTIDRLMAAPDPPTLVGTYRPHVADDPRPLGELIGALERRHRVLHLHLDVLSGAEVRQFVRATFHDDEPDDRAVERLVQQTSGNPFLLQQLLAGDAAAIQPFSDASMPWTLASSFRRELDALTPGEVDVLAMAAVLGLDFDFDLLQRASGRSESELIPILRSLRDRQLIREGEVDEFRFRHDLLRVAMLDGMLGRELRRCHDAAFEALSISAPDDYAELARHAKGAGRIDDLVSLAPAGVRHYLATGSTRRASLLAQAALAARPADADFLGLAARAAWLSGQLDEARDIGERWHEAQRRAASGGCVDDLEPIMLLARVAYEAGDVERRSELLEELLDWLRIADGDRQQAEVHAAVAQHAMLDKRIDEAMVHADRAIELAQGVGADDIVRRATVERATTRLLHGDVEAGLAELTAVAEDAERAGDHHTAARAWYNLPATSDVDAEAQALRRMRAAAVRVGAEQLATSAYTHRRVDLAIRRGHLQEANAWASQARMLGVGSEVARHLALSESSLAVESGEVELGRQLLGRLDDVGGPAMVRVAALVAARIALRDGEVDRAVALLGEHDAVGGLALNLILTAREFLDAGATPAQMRELSGLVPPDRPNVSLVVAAGVTVGVLLGDREAIDDLEGLVDRPFHWDTNERFFEPWTKLLNAELHLAAARYRLLTDTDGAERHAAAAAELLVDWPGSRRDEAMRLRGCASEAISHESPLTGREIDVARLLTLGMTNGEIAEELHIARKTASTHVSNILMKLGMRSRTEIATWAVKTGVAS